MAQPLWVAKTSSLARRIDFPPRSASSWRMLALILTILRGTNDPVVAERMAKDCLILPAAGVDLAAVAQLADTAVTKGQGHEYLLYFEFAKGLAEYRQGHFASAVDWSQKVLASSGEDYRDAQAYLVLAMAQYQARQPKESHTALAKGAEIIETKLPRLESGDIGDSWTDWIIAHVLMSEAKAMVEGSARMPETNK